MNIKKYARAIGKYLSDSNYRFLMNAGLGKYNNLSDKKYLERKFECCMGKSLDFEGPLGALLLAHARQWYNRGRFR